MATTLLLDAPPPSGIQTLVNKALPFPQKSPSFSIGRPGGRTRNYPGFRVQRSGSRVVRALPQLSQRAWDSAETRREGILRASCGFSLENGKMDYRD